MGTKTPEAVKSQTPEPPFPALRALVARVEEIADEACEIYIEEVQAIANKHGVKIAMGRMSNFWQVKKPRARKWLHELDDKHPALDDLEALDKIALKIHTGRPTPGVRVRFLLEPQEPWCAGESEF